MRTGIATVCLSGTLREKMQACAIAGFDGIEIFEQDLVTSPLSPEEVRKMAADLGLTLDLYQPFRDFDSVSGGPARRQPAPGGGEVPADVPARHGHHPGLLQRGHRQH